MTEAWAILVSGALGATATLAGLFYASRQLRLTAVQQADSERWKRAEFGAALVAKLSENDELAFCARALDWGVGPLVIPEKHRSLFPPATVTFDHDWNVLATALRPNLDFSWSDPRALTYRYSFDAFFSYLEHIYAHLKLNNIDRSQLIGLGYYIKLIKTPLYHQSADVDGVFKAFIVRFYPALINFIWGSSE